MSKTRKIIVILICALFLPVNISMAKDKHIKKAKSALDLQLIFYGYPKQGISQSGMAMINNSGLSNVHDVTFMRDGGELSPNGRFIAYDNCSDPGHGIYLANPDGSNSRKLISLTSKSCLNSIRWSPDSTKLSYSSSGPLHVLDIASKRDRLIPNTRGSDLHCWSPAGDEIVYGKSGQSETAFRLLYITDLNGNNRQITFENDFVPCGSDYNKIDTWAPAWSPDGKTITFTQCDNLFVMSPTGRDLRQLTTSRNNSRLLPNGPFTTAYSPRWSPDSRWIIFIGDTDVLKRISVDGNTIVEIGKLPYWGGSFSIAPAQTKRKGGVGRKKTMY